MTVYRSLLRYHSRLLYAISPATIRVSRSRDARLAGRLLRSGRDLCSRAENRHGVSVATSDKRRQRFIYDFGRRELDSGCQMDDVEMLDVSCRIYDDVGRSRVYYLVRWRTAKTDYTMIDAEPLKRETEERCTCSLREITLSKTELNSLVKAFYFYPRCLYLPRRNFIAVWFT